MCGYLREQSNRFCAPVRVRVLSEWPSAEHLTEMTQESRGGALRRLFRVGEGLLELGLFATSKVQAWGVSRTSEMLLWRKGCLMAEI